MSKVLRSVSLVLAMLFLGSSVLMAQTVHQVAAGTDVLGPAITAAAEGDIIELTTSGGAYLSTSMFTLDKSITIRGAEDLLEKPVIKYIGTSTSAYIFRVPGSQEVTLQNLDINGDGTAEGGAARARYAMRLDNADVNGTMVVRVLDCEMHEFSEKIIRPYADCGIDSIIVHNSMLYNSDREGICLYSGSSSDPQVNLDYAEISNCTFYNLGRDAIKGDTNPNTVVRVDHCTFYDIGTLGKPVLFFDDHLDVEVKNSIFVKNTYGSYFARFEDSQSSFHHNSVWDVASWSVASATTSDTTRVDPLFADAANGDFTLDGTSPVMSLGDDGQPLGDLRWPAIEGKFKLTLVANGSGNIVADPAGPYYDPNTSVTLTAVPEQDWKIVDWEGVSVFPPDAATATITMDADKEVTVNFELALEKFAVNVATMGVGHVEFSPGPADSATWSYYEGTEVIMTAVSDSTSMTFSEWTGDLTGTQNPDTITVSAEMNITAVFTPTVTQYTLDVDTVGLGNVLLNPAPYSDYGTFDEGTEVLLVAQPLTGFEFSAWSGAVTEINDSVTVTMNSDLNITATFTEIAVANGELQIDTTSTLQEAVEFARNNSQVKSIVLTTSGGVYETYEAIKVNFPLSIKAAEGLEERPKIEGNPDLNYANGIFLIYAGGSKLELQGLEMYWAKYGVRTYAEEMNAVIYIDDCYIHDIGASWIKGYSGSFVDTLIVTNSMFRECKYEGVYFRDPNTLDYASFENTTFIRSGRQAFRSRDNVEATFIANHCTFDSISWNANYRVCYPEDIKHTTFKNCIITNQMFSTERHVDFIRVYGNSTVSNVVTFNASNNANPEEEAVIDTTTIWEFDPLYTNTTEWDYTLTEASHAYDIADDGSALGDLVWATNTPTHKKINLTIAGNGSVEYTPEPVGLTWDPNTEVTVTAVPDSNYKFVEWSGELTGTDNPQTVTLSADVNITATFSIIDAIEDENNLPKEYALHQNYPNPFNPQTTIRVDLKQAGQTKLKIYNVLGQNVITLIDKKMQAGSYNVVLNQPQLPSGVYFYKLQSGNFTAIKKMMLIK